MVLRRAIKLSLASIVLLFFAVQVFSYDNLVIHPALSLGAIEIYNQQASRKLTEEQKNWIVQGSIDEDADPRYLNHFFDPTTGKGLDGRISAKDWSQNQDGLIGMTGDYSEAAILDNYKIGNYHRAYQGIGHMLHLIQDMSVPAHARNDSHPDGDPFENWSKINGRVNLNKAKFINLESVSNAFDDLARYSNNNFLSKDTVVIDYGKHELKTEVVDGKNVYYTMNEIDKTTYRLAFVKYPDSLKPIMQISNDLKLNLDYWNMLHPKAVGYSAGVIDYFERKFAEIDENRTVEEVSFWQKTKNYFTSTKNELEYRTGETIAYLRGNLHYSVDSIAGYARDFGQNLGFFGEATNETITKVAEKTSETAIKQTDILINQAKNAGVLGQKIYSDGKKVIQSNVVIKPKKAQASDAGNTTNEQNSLILVPDAEIIRDDLILPPTNSSSSLPYEKTSSGFKYFSIGSGPIFQLPPPVLSPTSTPTTTPIVNTTSTPEEIITSIIKYPDSISSSSEAEFIFSASKSGVGFSLNFDDSGWQSVHKEVTITAADGEHTLKVKAIDPAASSTIAVWNWRIDTQKPQLDIIDKPSRYSSSTSASFQFQTDELVIYSCSLNQEPLLFCGPNTMIEDLIEDSYLFEVKAEDRSGNFATSSFEWLVDLTKPNVILANLESSYIQTGFGLNWLGEDEQSGVDVYSLQKQIDLGEWEDWFSETNATSTIFDLPIEPGQSIAFRAKASDKAFNLSDWSHEVKTKILKFPADHAVISELYIDEINQGSEWIELYNPTDTEISLTGWTIDTKANNKDISLPEGANIPPHGFYLIGDKADNKWNPDSESWSTPNYNETMSLTNTDGWVKLKDITGKVVDGAGWGNSNYFEDKAINTSGFLEGYSFERKAYSSSTLELMSSGGEHQFSGNGYDSDNNEKDFITRSFPTPENSSARIEKTDTENFSSDDVAVWHLDESEGKVAKDSTENGGDMGWEYNPYAGGRNLPEKSSGKFDLATKFRQNPEHYLKNFSPEIELTDGVTVGTWIKTSLVNDSSSRVWWLGDTRNYADIPQNYLKLSIKNGKACLSIKQKFAEENLCSVESVNDNSWHQIVVRVDNREKRMNVFIDGEKQSDVRLANKLPKLAFFSVGYNEGGSPAGISFDGEIDELFINKSVISDNDIINIYQSNKPYGGEIIIPELEAAEIVAHYKFDETRGNTAMDSSENNYNLNWQFNEWSLGAFHPRWSEGKYDGSIFNF
ncbi:MAG: putative secreted protein, periplasmic copper-binding protein (NosD) family [Candidatus Falkowbacteria bacterium GW2011_GWF2_39_8]|uniref:Putative secreted protein, periplasmic copper-binding protein (NosD) family n=1 Tax=Candidatus Falkowbacteria bacterium GW2011_GWF2_39_8 TaxID=1618642 RepID=A0A0G0PVP4_9BACT|nr:MAG: putative secreted protein, periplasmic copper-binding protein (NosD) family [Candidatus Falkowbacteria bacterium GW2011_GWF2_39_8]